MSFRLAQTTLLESATGKDTISDSAATAALAYRTRYKANRQSSCWMVISVCVLAELTCFAAQANKKRQYTRSWWKPIADAVRMLPWEMAQLIALFCVDLREFDIHFSGVDMVLEPADLAAAKQT